MFIYKYQGNNFSDIAPLQKESSNPNEHAISQAGGYDPTEIKSSKTNSSPSVPCAESDEIELAAGMDCGSVVEERPDRYPGYVRTEVADILAA